MAEEPENKEEEKLEFTPEVEALSYISLEQARVVAMQAARDEPGNYGSRFSGAQMVFEVVEQEEGDDYYVITLSFRPAGDYAGAPGQEQFFIEKEGAVAIRQTLSLPRPEDGRRLAIVPILGGLVAIAVVGIAGAVFISGGLGGGDDSEIPAVLVPAATPPAALASPIPAESATRALTPTPTLAPTPTPAIVQREVQVVVTATPRPTPVPTRTPTPVPTPTPAIVQREVQVVVTATPGPTTTPVPTQIPVILQREVQVVVTATPRPTATPIPPKPTVVSMPLGQQLGVIAFTSSRDGNREIYVMNPDGTNVARLTNNASTDWRPIWYPDGTRILFESRRSGGYDLYSIAPDGQDLLMLTRLSSEGPLFPAWSPDGVKIAFISGPNGNAQIYLVNSDGSGLIRLTNNAYDDRWPRWSRV